MSDVLYRDDIDHDVWAERRRQDQLKAEGRFTYTCADPEMSDDLRCVVLMEEVGEAARECLPDGRRDKLRAELIQVAAVCHAWIEAIDAETGSLDPEVAQTLAAVEWFGDRSIVLDDPRR